MLFACKSREFPEDADAQSMIRFGSGGGITGFYTTYMLLDDGRLFMQKDPKKEAVWLSKVPAKVRKALFAQADSAGIRDMNYKEPGNMTYFIDVVESGAHHEVSWGDSPTPKDPRLDAMYKGLIELTRAAE